MKSIAPFYCAPLCGRSQQVGGFFSNWFGIDDAITTGAALDAKLKALNNQMAADGKWTAQQAAEANARIDAGGAQTYLDDFNNTVENSLPGAPGYVEYYKAQVDDLAKSFAGILTVPWYAAGAGISTVLKSIPWWAWLGIAGYGAYKVGLFDIARKEAKRRIVNRYGNTK